MSDLLTLSSKPFCNLSSLCMLFSGPATSLHLPESNTPNMKDYEVHISSTHTLLRFSLHTECSNFTTSTRAGKEYENETEHNNISELNEQYKVSLCSIFHVQGYCGPAWTHTVLVLSASKLIQP